VNNLPNTPGAAPLAVGTPQAALMVGISARTLWANTSPRGTLRCARIGTRVVYEIDELRRWLAEQAAKGGGDARA
jgi:hypothetical protein